MSDKSLGGSEMVAKDAPREHGVAQRMFGSLRRWYHRRATVGELMALSDRQLEDIGIPRSQIPSVVNRLMQGARAEVAAPTAAILPFEAARSKVPAPANDDSRNAAA